MIVKGDINGDGKVDVFDLMLCWLFVNEHLSLLIPSNSREFIAADIDGDGKITQDDYNRIRRHIRGEILITEVVEDNGAESALQF